MDTSKNIYRIRKSYRLFHIEIQKTYRVCVGSIERVYYVKRWGIFKRRMTESLPEYKKVIGWVPVSVLGGYCDHDCWDRIGLQIPELPACKTETEARQQIDIWREPDQIIEINYEQ